MLVSEMVASSEERMIMSGMMVSSEERMIMSRMMMSSEERMIISGMMVPSEEKDVCVIWRKDASVTRACQQIQVKTLTYRVMHIITGCYDTGGGAC